jgi:hypothetical protein
MCECKKKWYVLRFFSNAEYKNRDVYAPKWAFHVESICGDCKKHIGFEPQTKELIEKLNFRKLSKVKCLEKRKSQLVQKQTKKN